MEKAGSWSIFFDAPQKRGANWINRFEKKTVLFRTIPQVFEKSQKLVKIAPKIKYLLTFFYPHLLDYF